MIHLTQQTRILLAVKPTDFRRQIDGLVVHCQQQLKGDPRSGVLFVFINRAKTMIRFLQYDGSGYWVATKRLSQGRYHGWPSGDGALSAIAADRLMKLIKSTACEVKKNSVD